MPITDQKVASDEKLRLGCTLGYALTGDSSCLTQQCLPTTSSRNQLPTLLTHSKPLNARDRCNFQI